MFPCGRTRLGARPAFVRGGRRIFLLIIFAGVVK
ncbi:hypothetical protein B23_1156 [Geobacillus thermoleovorans B23]|nr:hypothetical protein B23_1156 [Geobacillus thermoleovorans B23]